MALTAPLRTASITLSGTPGAIGATPNTAQFAQLITLSKGVAASGGVVGSMPLVTPGSTVTAQMGGDNFLTDSGTAAGQHSVTTGDLSILASTDSGVPLSGSGSFEAFGGSTGMTYATFGDWSLNACSIASSCLPTYAGSFAGAQPGGTQTITMPTTGSALYHGAAVGYVIQPAGTSTNNAAQFWGSTFLTANFGANTIDGQIVSITAYSVGNGGSGQTNLGTINNIGLSGTISGSSFSGTTSVTGPAGSAFDISGATGQLSGGFYGPNANEVAGVFNLNGGANNTTLVGSFGGVQAAKEFSASLSLVNAAVGFTATPNTALFNDAEPLLKLYSPGAPNGYFTLETIATPLGSLTIIPGLISGTYTGSAVGNNGNVIKSGLLVVSSTDPLVLNNSTGNSESFRNVVGLTYADFGDWTVGSSPLYMGVTAGGQMNVLQTAAMPTTGSANYAGGAVGYVVQPAGTGPNNGAQFFGTSVLSANFGTNAITGAIININAFGLNGGASLGTINNIGLTGTISGSSFSGTTSVTGTAGSAFDISGATGLLSGGFYGPNANEVAGVFNLNGGANNTTLEGSFGAKKAATEFNASMTLSSTVAGISATPNTALFGNAQPIFNMYVPGGALQLWPITTPGGSLTTIPGLLSGTTTTGTAVGNNGNVIRGSLLIGSSSDSAIPTNGSGTFESFNNVVGLTYANFGDWSVSACGLGGSCLPTYFGVSAGGQMGVLQTAAMPTTGSAVYQGGAVGYVVQPAGTGPNNAAQFWGTASLNANFGTNAITGLIFGINAFSLTSGATGQTNLGSINNIGLSGTISGSAFSGTTSVAGTAGTAFDISGATGNFTGGFYGPNANELAGVFNLNGGANNTTLEGSFGAKPGTMVYSASVSLSGTPSAIIATPNNALFGNAQPMTKYYLPGANIPIWSYQTPGGLVVVLYDYAHGTSAGSAAGNIGNVSKGNLIIANSTDSAIPTTGSATYENFNTVVGLSYANFGDWTLSACAATASCMPTDIGVSAGGQFGVTQTAAMPTQGSLSYSGGAVGYVGQPAGTGPNNAAQFYGTSNLTADLSNNTITGSITGIQAYSVGNGGAGQTLLGSINNIGLSGTISGSAFSGSSTVTGPAGSAFDISGASGSLTGGFYGPNANEVAGLFNLNGGANNTALVGSFGAKQQATGFSAMLTLGGSLSAMTATPNAALFSNRQPTSPVVPNPGVPDQFTLTGTALTPGGSVTSQLGGANFVTNTGSAAGQTGNVTGLNSTILASTDSAVPTTGYGSVEVFADAVGLSYASFGVWAMSPCASGSSCLPSYVGVNAGGGTNLQTSAMPVNGTATYTGGAVGYVVQPVGTGPNNAAQFWGTSSITANFGTNTMTGAITNINAYTFQTTVTASQSLLGTMNNIALAATISGSTFAGTTSASATPGTAFNIAGATGNITGAFYGPAANEVAGIFSLNGGANNTPLIGSLGAKTATAPSDRRLKTDITPAGTLPGGLRLYSWRYLGGTHRFTGVMAQDLLADARFAASVHQDSDGLMRVDYASIGYTPADMATMQAEGEAAVTRYRATRH